VEQQANSAGTPEGRIVHFAVWFDSKVMGFFELERRAASVADLLGGTIQQIDGPMPTNIELCAEELQTARAHEAYELARQEAESAADLEVESRLPEYEDRSFADERSTVSLLPGARLQSGLHVAAG
jgi:hypothetical protein